MRLRSVIDSKKEQITFELLPKNSRDRKLLRRLRRTIAYDEFVALWRVFKFDARGRLITVLPLYSDKTMKRRDGEDIEAEKKRRKQAEEDWRVHQDSINSPG